MSHPLGLALFESAAAAAAAVEAVRGLGISGDRISIVAHDHKEARALADQMGATPGVELEDSRTAGRVGEVSARVLAAITSVMPGIGPIVAAGPLAAELGEAAGHAAGGLASVLGSAGLPRPRAEALQRGIAHQAVLVGVHCDARDADRVLDRLRSSGATQLDMVTWP
jgi:hypothetical protein